MKDLKPAGIVNIVIDSVVQVFHIRVTPAGAKTFAVTFQRPGGVKVHVSIGSAGAWTVDKAKEQSAKFREVIPFRKLEVWGGLWVRVGSRKRRTPLRGLGPLGAAPLLFQQLFVEAATVWCNLLPPYGGQHADFRVPFFCIFYWNTSRLHNLMGNKIHQQGIWACIYWAPKERHHGDYDRRYGIPRETHSRTIFGKSDH